MWELSLLWEQPCSSTTSLLGLKLRASSLDVWKKWERRKDGCSCIYDWRKWRYTCIHSEIRAGERQVSRNVNLASLLYASVCDAPFKPDESSLIMPYVFFLSLCFWSKLNRVSCHTLNHCLVYIHFKFHLAEWPIQKLQRFYFLLICDKCVAGCHGFMAESS